MNDLIQSLTFIKKHAQCSTSPFPFVHLFTRIILKEIKVIMQNIFIAEWTAHLFWEEPYRYIMSRQLVQTKGAGVWGLWLRPHEIRTFLKLHSS